MAPTMTTWDDWGGVICLGCGDEVFRLVESVCVSCARGRKQKRERALERRLLIRHLRRKIRAGGGYEGETLR